MPALGIGIAWFGYAIFYYGLTQVQSGNWGFLDLIVPGRWTPAVAATPKDVGAGATINTPGGPVGPVTSSGKSFASSPFAKLPSAGGKPGGPVKSSPGSSTQGTGVYG